jgi:opacity protein-like surface antigen
MKKTLAPLTLAAFMLAQSAQAGEIILGIDGFNATVNTNFTETVAAPATNFAASGQNSQFGGGVYLGYVWNVNSGFNINLEGYFDYFNQTVTESLLAPLPLTEKIGNIWGLRALPAFKITNNTEIYIELGWAYLPVTFTDPNIGGSSIKQNTSAFRYGAGVQTMLYDNISLRIFYTIIDEMQTLTLTNTNPAYGKFTAQPNLSEFGVGVAYHFQL